MTPLPCRPHVMMTCDAIGGVWTYATVLASELYRRGWDVTLVTLGPMPRRDQIRTFHALSGADLIVTDLALEWEDPEGADIAHTEECLLELERRLRPDVVHLNGYREACASWMAPVLVVAHSCVRSWWLACRGCEPTKDEPRWRSYIGEVAAGLAAADAWVAPTGAFRDEIQKLYQPARAGRIIRNGVSPAVRPVRKEPRILTAGRMWDEAKNVSALAAVAEDLPWQVQVAGPLSHANARAHPMAARNLRLLGAVSHDDLLSLMQKAVIYVAPAVYEPFGLTVLEAAASGCALVLSDIPAYRELWSGAAMFVPPRDHAALRAGLQQLCLDDMQRHGLQRQALRRARRYTISAMAEGYLDVYGEMIGKFGRGARSSIRNHIPLKARA